ncbi:MAG: DUF4845 domain-containing protein [Pseudomonadales bacterium]
MNIKKQQGMSGLGMLMAVVLVVSVMLLTMKLVPVYINDYAIGNAVASLKDDANLYSRSKTEIRKIIRKKLKADYTDDLSNDAITIEKNKGVITIDVLYETRVPVIANIDLIATFSHQLEKKK